MPRVVGVHVFACPRGHPYNDENTYTDPRGKHNCRVCARERERAQRKTLRAAETQEQREARRLAASQAKSAGRRRYVVYRDALDRLADKFVFAPDGCWLWQGALYENGYASFWFDGKTGRAHRFIYELLVGSIPEHLQLDHLCRVRHCVNPAHLEPVTNAENGMRGVRARALSRDVAGS
jgi:hypothetical protein